MIRFKALALIFFGTLSTIGCGCAEKRDKVVEVPDEVSAYVVRFSQIGGDRGAPVAIDDLIIRFADIPNPFENGACEVAGNATPQVTLDVHAWASMDDAEREALVFHELGHCVLRRRHRDDRIQGVPKSVMYTYALNSSIYTYYYDSYLNELYSIRNEF